MRKYYISRRSVTTTLTLKVCNTTTFEVADREVTVDGSFASAADALNAVNKSWEDETSKPIAVTGMACKIQTRGMTAAEWFDKAALIDEVECTPEEAAAFGKRSKKSDVADAQ